MCGAEVARRHQGASVLHVINQPDGGGAERVVRELNRRLPAHGVESRVVYFCNPRNLPLDQTEFELGCSGPRDWRAGSRLARYLEDFDAEKWIIHAHLSHPLYLIGLLPGAQRFRRVFTEHSTWNRRRAWDWLRGVERRVYGRYERIVTVSGGTREALGRWIGHGRGRPDVDVIENGVRTFWSERERTFPAGGLRLISVGSLTERKGLSVAIEAVARLDCALERYLIVGVGPERPRLEKRVAELGLSDKVEFVGWRDDVGALLDASDMQLMPSRWEGFGVAAVEGLSVGLPMVVANVPGLSDVVGGLPGVILVDDHDPSSFSRAIERMCRLRHCWPEFADAAIERARLYTVDAMATRHSPAVSADCQRGIT